MGGLEAGLKRQEKASSADVGTEKIADNILLVTTPAGKYRIIGGLHYTSEQNAQELGSNYWGIALEHAENTDVSNRESIHDPSIQYKGIVETAFKDNKPLFFTDISGSDSDLYAFGLPLAEIAATWVLARYITKPRDNEKGMTRRNFLKMAAVAPVAYMTTDTLLNVLMSGSAMAGWNEANSKIAHFKESGFPREMYLLRLRNLIAAEKMEELSRDLKAYANNRELAAVYGQSHMKGLAEALTMGHEKRMQEIARLASVLPMPLTNPENYARVMWFYPALSGPGDLTKKQWIPGGQYLNKDILEVIS